MTVPSDRAWSVIGKLATVVAILGGVATIYTSIIRAEYSVRAEGDMSPVYISPASISAADTLARLAEARIMQIDSLRDILHGREPYVVEREPQYDPVGLRSQKSCWRFRISNNGRREISTLTLQVPFDGYYALSQPSQQAGEGSFARSINFGPLRPSDEATIVCWSNNEPLFSWFAFDNIRVTYQSGWARYGWHRT